MIHLPSNQQRAKRIAILALPALLLAILGGVAMAISQDQTSTRDGTVGVGTSPIPEAPRGTQPTEPQGGSTSGDPAAYQIERLRAFTPAAADHKVETIQGEAAQQPDLYAAEFVRRLLTQDYRTDRESLVRWVDAESATTREPLVVGLIPAELRDRYAVFSVTDAVDTPAPIPTATEWEALGVQRGYTSVTIDRVEEPLAWTNAVASGRITDPGITGRDVSATVVRHLIVDGKERAAKFSVALSLNLEGPPTRPTWGFVAAVTYTSIQVS